MQFKEHSGYDNIILWINLLRFIKDQKNAAQK